jgi:hypothetical protein
VPHRRPAISQQDQDAHRLTNVNARICNGRLDCRSVQSSRRRPLGLVARRYLVRPGSCAICNGATTMKLALSALVIAVSGCASQPSSPPPLEVRPVGQSQLAPKAAAICIAQKWIASSGQTAVIQYVYANETAFDVFVPGQQPPSGSAALVRPAPSGTGSAVSFRGPAVSADGAIGQCA